MSGDKIGGFRFTTLPGGWEVGRFEALNALPGIGHAVTTRRALEPALARADPAAAAAHVAARLGLDAVAFCNQVHGADVPRVDSGGLAGEADGLLTDTPSVGLMGSSADCPLLLAADVGGTAVAMAHASWRGTIQGIAVGLIQAIRVEFGIEAGQIVACIGPGAGPCCYEVGGEIVDAAAASLGPRAERFFRQGGPGKFLFDLWAANRDQLLGAGLAPDHVHTAGICTICRNDLFPSYRVEAEAAGRFVAVIGRTRQG